jgi:von Willebrand factor A domain-containing protein 8
VVEADRIDLTRAIQCTKYPVDWWAVISWRFHGTVVDWRQVPDELKAEVSREAKERAKSMAQDALAQRLKEIEMTASESQLYSRVMEAVAREIAQLRVVLQGAETRSKERSWLKNQTAGDFDDAKLVWC